MPCRDNGAVVFVVEGGRAEVNKYNVRIPDHTQFASLLWAVLHIVVVVDKEDILWFEVSVCEPC